MDKSSKIVDEKLKEEVKRSLLEKIIVGLELKRMDLAQKKESAGYILDRMDAIKDYTELVLFLDALQQRWPIYTDVYNLFKNRFYKDKEKDVINKLTSYIHKLN